MKITAAFIVTALAAPPVLAESPGDDAQEGTPEQHQYKNENRAADEGRDAHNQDQTEEGACGAAD